MSITITLQRYVNDTFMPPESRTELTAQTPLLELGVLDSFSMLRLVEWIESQFAIKLGAHEITAENFNNLHAITNIIERHVTQP